VVDVILTVQGRLLEQTNIAKGQAQALFTVAEATAQSIERIATAINKPV
jgi:regulator of protease activity HflC (stomatin/prohibitin superfamily)